MSLTNSRESNDVVASEFCPSLPRSQPITITCEDRWQVYHRLQTLGIDCQCSGFQPLEVDIHTPTEALQLWSVVRHVSMPRSLLVDMLNGCWHMPYARSCEH